MYLWEVRLVQEDVGADAGMLTMVLLQEHGTDENGSDCCETGERRQLVAGKT